MNLHVYIEWIVRVSNQTYVKNANNVYYSLYNQIIQPFISKIEIVHDSREKTAYYQFIYL